MKLCPRCGKETDDWAAAGLCKPCKADYDREYYKANRDKVNAARRARRKRDPEQAVKDRLDRQRKIERNRKAHYERQYERTKRYRASHPEKYREINRNAYYRNRSPFGPELGQAMRVLRQLKKEIANAKEQD